MADPMDALDGIAAALMVIEVYGSFQQLLPNLFPNGKRLRNSISVMDSILTGLLESTEIQDGKAIAFLLHPLHFTFPYLLSPPVQQ